MEKPKFENISAEEGDGTKNSIIEARSGFSTAAREEFAGSVLAYINRETKEGRAPNEQEIEARISRYLRHRQSRDELNVLDKKFSEHEHIVFEDLVENTFRNLTREGMFQHLKGEGWTYIQHMV